MKFNREELINNKELLTNGLYEEIIELAKDINEDYIKIEYSLNEAQCCSNFSIKYGKEERIKAFINHLSDNTIPDIIDKHFLDVEEHNLEIVSVVGYERDETEKYFMVTEKGKKYFEELERKGLSFKIKNLISKIIKR